MVAMSGLLEVLVADARDAERAEAGGADRVQVVGARQDGGMSPEPAAVARIRAATSVQVRPIVRLREGFSTDGGELARLKGLIAAYLEAGADGMVLGFVNGLGRVDAEVVSALTSEGTWPWTFHRAFDACFDTDLAWRVVESLDRLDGVMTAGSARDVEHGLDDLVRRAKANSRSARLILAAGGLRPEHVPWLGRAGIAAFHVDEQVREGGTAAGAVAQDRVHAWRILVDAEVGRANR